MKILNPNLKVHPLSLDRQGHLYDLQDMWQGPLPVVHLLLKGLDEAGGFHCWQGHLVVLKDLEDLVRGSVKMKGQGLMEGQRWKVKVNGSLNEKVGRLKQILIGNSVRIGGQRLTGGQRWKEGQR